MFSSLRVLIAAVLTASVLTAGCTSSNDGGGASGKSKRIIFLTNGDDPFWDAAREGLRKAAEELNLEEAGFEAVQHRGNFTAAVQIDHLNQYATETDVAAVAISITEPDNKQLMNALRRLAERSIEVITVDSDVNREKYRDVRFAYLGTDNIIGGRQLGKAAAKLRADGGTYMTFVGNAEQGNSVERINGFAEGAGEKFKSVGCYTDGGNEQVALDRVRAALDNYPELNTLVGIWAYNAHAIVQRVKDRNLRDKTTILVFDARKIALDDMEEGYIDAMVVQNPYQMGYLSVKLLKAMLDDDGAAIQEILPNFDPASGKFSTADGDIQDTELRVVVPDDSSVLSARDFDESVIFFRLKEFRKWLADRNLEGS
jgi:ribose transport system substrate-binding protein